jgi:hypothetical protein
MLDALLALRLREVEAVTLPRLVAGDPQLRRASAKLAEAMFRSRDRIGDDLAAEISRQAFASRMTKGMLQYLTRGYQYIDIAEVQLPKLAAIYISFVDCLAQLASIQERAKWSHALESMLETHHQELQQWVAAELEAVGALATISGGVMPACGQYSPELQLAVLGIEPSFLSGPILDLGCGEKGLLVQALREMGHTRVVGVDRNAATTDLLQGSWFEAPLEQNHWSLVIAHQSFSLHLLHAHLQSQRSAMRYVRHYMTILRALRIGGRFVYAPNLPFLEALLPVDQFKVTVKAGPFKRLTHAPEAIRTLYGPSGLGSATIERIA